MVTVTALAAVCLSPHRTDLEGFAGPDHIGGRYRLGWDRKKVVSVFREVQVATPTSRMPIMQVIEAQYASILEPHDHLHNKS